MNHYVLVCGSRTYTNGDLIRAHLSELRDAYGDGRVRVIHGAAEGADSLAQAAAEALNLRVKSFPADWSKHGKRAGYLRNLQMLDLLLDRRSEGHWVEVIAYTSGPLETSKGTAMMVKLAREAQVKTSVYEASSAAARGEGTNQ